MERGSCRQRATMKLNPTSSPRPAARSWSLAAYLKGAKDLKKGLIDKALEDNPFAQLRIALLGYPGVFEPAVAEAVARILTPPYLGMGIDFFTNRFLPAQLYKPTRTAETIEELAD